MTEAKGLADVMRRNAYSSRRVRMEHGNAVGEGREQNHGLRQKRRCVGSDGVGNLRVGIKRQVRAVLLYRAQGEKRD